MDYVSLSEDLLVDIGLALDESENDKGLPQAILPPACGNPTWKAAVSGGSCQWIAFTNVIGVQGQYGFTAHVICGDAATAGHIRYLLNFFKVHVPTTY